MLKPDKRCLVCQTLKTDRKLMQRIYESKAFIKGGESLRSIARDYEGTFEYQSLYNHTKNHQALTEEDLETRRMKVMAQKAQVAMINEALNHKAMRDDILQIGVEGIKEGEIRLKASDVVSLLKQKADIESKEKDQELEMAKMIADFASGAVTNIIEGEIVGQE